MIKSNLSIGQTVKFACNGRGRGGHYGVTGVVTKINRSTANITEADRSYRPGTLWKVSIENLEAQIIKVSV